MPCKRPSIFVITGIRIESNLHCFQPGTGKTATVTELILQAVAMKKRLLVCAPSNVAVDNVLERVVQAAAKADRKMKKPRCVRLGHPARVSPTILRYCLDALIARDEVGFPLKLIE